MSDVILKIDEIPIGSIWMAADGGDYGYVVRGIDLMRGDVLVQPFDSRGWRFVPDRIDWFKLQYRYYMVCACEKGEG